MHRQPLIGISGSMNTEESQYFIKRDYVRSLTEAGAIPLLLAPDMTDEQARQCAEELDGLLLSGAMTFRPAALVRSRCRAWARSIPCGIRVNCGWSSFFWKKKSPFWASAGAFKC